LATIIFSRRQSKKAKDKKTSRRAAPAVEIQCASAASTQEARVFQTMACWPVFTPVKWRATRLEEANRAAKRNRQNRHRRCWAASSSPLPPTAGLRCPTSRLPLIKTLRCGPAEAAGKLENTRCIALEKRQNPPKGGKGLEYPGRA
jgi:hypothetical protein